MNELLQSLSSSMRSSFLSERVFCGSFLLFGGALVLFISGTIFGLMALYSYSVSHWGKIEALFILSGASLGIGLLCLGMRRLTKPSKTPLRTGLNLLEDGLSHLPNFDFLGKLISLPRFKALAPYIALGVASFYLTHKKDQA